MEKKIVMITGANSGIGKAATYRFAQEGYHVIMACRDRVHSKEVEAEIKEQLGDVSIDSMQVDMGSFESINKFCQKFKSKYPKLDILIHNAGCFNHGVKQYQKSIDNLELTFAVNVFGPYLMTMLLRALLVKSDDARILGASSNNILHFFDENRAIDFENLLGQQETGDAYNAYKMYGDSKMALGMIHERMSEVFKADGIQVNTLMIGGAKLSKRTLKKFSPGFRILGTIQNLFLRPTTFMANNYFQICTSDKFKGITGKMISDQGVILKSAPQKMGSLSSFKQLLVKSTYYPYYADNKIIQDRLWQLCQEVTRNIV